MSDLKEILSRLLDKEQELEDEIADLEGQLSEDDDSGAALLDDLKDQLEELRETKESLMQDILDEDTDNEA